LAAKHGATKAELQVQVCCGPITILCPCSRAFFSRSFRICHDAWRCESRANVKNTALHGLFPSCRSPETCSPRYWPLAAPIRGRSTGGIAAKEGRDSSRSKLHSAIEEHGHMCTAVSTIPRKKFSKSAVKFPACVQKRLGSATASGVSTRTNEMRVNGKVYNVDHLFHQKLSDEHASSQIDQGTAATYRTYITRSYSTACLVR
jgi:hypothetical protein